MNDKRRQRRQEYKLRNKSAGIFRINNTATGQALQSDFYRYGRDAFVIEIVEVVKPSDVPVFCVEAELERLEKVYAEQLDRGNTYNLRDRIRYP